MKNFQPLTLATESSVLREKHATMEESFSEARELLSSAEGDASKQADLLMDIVKQFMAFGNDLKMKRCIEKLSSQFQIPESDFNTVIRQIRKNNKQQENNSPLISRVESFISERYDIYFNEISNRFICSERGKNKYSELVIDNIYRDLKKSHIHFSISDLKSLMKSNFVQKKDIFLDYFNHLPFWDGEDHIGNFLSFIKVKELSANSNEESRFENMFRKMLVRSVACALKKDFNKHCFTLVEQKQSSGKTTFFRFLCPPGLSEYYAENIGTGKDDLIALTENFIINIDELSTLSKYDINSLKSVMSKNIVKVRLPYGERTEVLHRRCNFVASTNMLEFLNDETGSVRWICFLLDQINWAYHSKVDIDKVWAQAFFLFKEKKFNYQLTAEELKENDKCNLAFLIRSPELELIQKYLNPANKEQHSMRPESVKFYNSTDVITFLNEKTRSNFKLNTVNIGKSLKILGFQQVSLYDKSMRMSIKGYYVEIKDDGNLDYMD